MRLFVAVDAGVAAARAGPLLDDLRQRAARLSPRARITWVAPSRLHLTVRFIGHADAARAAEIQAVMATPLETRAFELGFAGLGAFPPSGKPHVLWAGIAAGEADLQRIEREVSARLATVGIPPEDRAYRPHLTLARIREAAGLRAATLFAGLEQASLGAARCEAITLYESRLSSNGPTYLPLVRTPLSGWP